MKMYFAIAARASRCCHAISALSQMTLLAAGAPRVIQPAGECIDVAARAAPTAVPNPTTKAALGGAADTAARY